MSTFTPRNYQRTAIKELVDALTTCLHRDGTKQRLIQFKAPTGSGKTVMLAKAFEEATARNQDRPFVTLWLTPGKGSLEVQSTRRLNDVLVHAPNAVHLLTPQLLAQGLAPVAGTILVSNWESLVRWDKDESDWENRLTRTGEQRNLFDYLTRCANDGFDLLLVFDEAHTHADGGQARKLRDAIAVILPFIELHASATPRDIVDRATEGQLRKDGRYHDPEVAFDDVVAEEMVKKTVELNPDLPAVRAAHPDFTAEQLALQAAWDKAESLRSGFAAEGSPVVPLLLVQVPDAGAGDQRIDATLAFFESVGLRQGKEIATWLDKKHTPNLAGISANSSPVRVLLFKHAVATGWDCPRAHVLVQFRDIDSTTFAIQTLGRILRMPELRHYPNEDLNTAYVYSDLDDDDVTVSCDDEPDRKVRDTTLRVRSDLYGHGLALVSVWAPRQRLHEYVSHSIAGHLTPRLDKALAGLPQQPVTRAAADILVDASIDTAALASLAEDLSVTGERLSADLSEERVRVISDALLVRDTRPYFNKRDSLPRIKTVVRSWFRANRPDYDSTHVAIACLLNRDVLTAAIHEACVSLSEDERTQAEEDARSGRTTVDNWEVPDNQRVAQASFQPATGPFLMVPALARCVDSDAESDFEKWLVSQGATVRWWWRNGGRDTTSLAVPYPDEAGVADGAITYPDYLVMTADGVLWVIEVKGLDDPDGHIDGPTHRKAKGLRAWATEMNQPPRFPGVVGSPRVETAVVVPHRSGTSTVVKCGNPDSWQPPTSANLAAESGWTSFSL